MLVLGGLVTAGLLTMGCRTRPAYGMSADLLPSVDRLRRAFVAAATDTQTWAPLAGAALLQVGDLDETVSKWGRDERPIFGRRAVAEDASDAIRNVALVGVATTHLLTPSSDNLWHGVRGKAQSTAIGVLAIRAQSTLVTELKDAFGRKRPLSDVRDSFPSSHAAWTATFGAYARRHVDAMPLPAIEKQIISGGFTATTGLVSWARVEAGRHYASDVLVGWAIGNFIALFVHDAFIGHTPGAPRVSVTAGPRAVGVGVTIQR